jgi:Tfp pilus assembly protein PilV
MITSPLTSRASSPRGSTLIELMIASAVLLVATTGFVGAMKEAVTATAVAHRRTEEALLRTGALERYTVARRDIVALLGTLTADPAKPTWVIESCYDANAISIGENPGASGGTWDATVASPAFCPAGAAVYRRWISAAPLPDAAGNAQRVWRVGVYVERVDQGCDAATRYSSLGCVAADTYLTD